MVSMVRWAGPGRQGETLDKWPLYHSAATNSIPISFARDTFRFCGGLFLDIKRKAPFFLSDFTDAIHIQALSAILFIYLGTVTNAITFGGLLGDATENMQVRPWSWIRSPRLSPSRSPPPFRMKCFSLPPPAGCAREFPGDSHCWWRFLPAGRPAAHHPEQHWSSSGF